ncbi:PQQ-dependent sugar dehydrogenase [Pyrobaculum sp.]|uniref:PQQ-dependent sugar dehydrogenase n=1 Tax=Pyrobaculum sp. TaxID=2004705 RepID=UPI00317A84CD
MHRRKLLTMALLAGLGLAIGRVINLLRKEGVDAVEFKTSIVASDLEVPWSITPLGGRRYLVTERPGRLVLISPSGKKLVASFDVASVGEAGLLGLALHPDFPKKTWVYLYASYFDSAGQIKNKLIKGRLDPLTFRLSEVKTLIEDIPGAYIHNGGRIRFGPDGMLYITTGDAAKPLLSQDLSSLGGKILRVDDDGKPPPDNPFLNSPIWSYGHRNPQGIDWHPDSGVMVATEHGPVGHDEVNVIVKGGNYGWPLAVGKADRGEFIDPIIESGGDTWAPSGASFVHGDAFPELRSWLLIACLRGSMILGVEFVNQMKVFGIHMFFKNVFGRLRDVVIDEDGGILISTSNRDGRGNPRDGDDKILKIVPA